MKLWALGRSSQLSWGTKCWMRFYRCSTLANRGSKISNITSFFSAKFQTIRNSVHKTLSWSHSEVLRDAEKKPKQNRNAEPVTNFVTKSRVPNKAFPPFTKGLLKIFQNAGPSSSDSGCVLAIIRPGGAATARIGRELSTLLRIKQRKITAAPTDLPVHLEEVVVWRETEQDHQSIKIKQLKTCHQYYSAITTVNIMMALWSKSASIFLQRGWNPGVSLELLVESTSNSYWTTWSWRRFGSKVPSPKFDVPSIFFSPWITFWMQEVPEIILHAAVSDCQAPFNVSSIKKLDDIL